MEEDVMNLSKRLKKIIELAPKSRCIADIGTDHGYVASELIRSGKAERVIATDINPQPLEKAVDTARRYHLEDKIDYRLGAGLKVLEPDEADGIIIAGMGGSQTVEILEDSPRVVKELKFILLQPAQNPEVVRKYLYDRHYRILSEDLVREDDGRFYEFFKAAYDPSILGFSHNPMDFLLSPVLLKRHHPLIRSYILHAVQEMEVVRSKLDMNYESSRIKNEELLKRKEYYLEELKWL